MKNVIAAASLALIALAAPPANATADDVHVMACSSGNQGSNETWARCDPGTTWVRAVAHCWTSPTSRRYGAWVKGRGATSVANCNGNGQRFTHSYETR